MMATSAKLWIAYLLIFIFLHDWLKMLNLSAKVWTNEASNSCLWIAYICLSFFHFFFYMIDIIGTDCKLMHDLSLLVPQGLGPAGMSSAKDVGPGMEIYEL